MKAVVGLCLFAIALVTGAARAEAIVAARYEMPVERYGHFAAGRPHEYARLVAETEDGRMLEFELPASEVFEDVAPRLVELSPDAPAQVLAILSGRETGARLALFGLGPDGLVLDAQSAPIGTPMRWLNPVGVADVDGDGEREIAAVITPHIGGTLKLFRRRGPALVEVAALAGFSNHVLGAHEQRLSAPVAVDGRIYLAVPDAGRRTLRVIAFENGALVEVGRCAPPASITGPIEVVATGRLLVGLASGAWAVRLVDCSG